MLADRCQCELGERAWSITGGQQEYRGQHALRLVVCFRHIVGGGVRHCVVWGLMYLSETLGEQLALPDPVAQSAQTVRVFTRAYPTIATEPRMVLACVDSCRTKILPFGVQSQC